jgi:hypothetical protein
MTSNGEVEGCAHRRAKDRGVQISCRAPDAGPHARYGAFERLLEGMLPPQPPR